MSLNLEIGLIVRSKEKNYWVMTLKKIEWAAIEYSRPLTEIGLPHKS